MELDNPCKYSFQDLLYAYDPLSDNIHLHKLYALSQNERNKKVKKMCDQIGWYYKDVRGKDGVIYTAFSPFQK